MKKRGIIVGGIAIVLLTVGIIFLICYNPDKPDGEADGGRNSMQTVLRIEDAEEIHIKSDTTNLRFVKKDGYWLIDGIAPSEVSAQKINALTESALTYRTDTVLDTAKLSEYGLDAPSLTVEINAADGVHTVTVGKKSAVDDAYFALADDVAFTMPASQYAALINDTDYYTSFSRLSIDADKITGIKLEYPEKTIDLYLPDEITNYEGNVWRMRSPYTTLANDTFIDSDMLEQIASLTLAKKAESLGEERAALTVTTEDRTYKLKIGSVNGGSVNVGYEGGVYSEPAELLAFVDADTFSFVNKLVSYVNINDISSYSVEYDGVTHTVDVSGSASKQSFKKDGKAADSDKSRSVYSKLIGVMAMGLYDNEPTGDTLLKVSFKGRGGASDCSVEYKRINEYMSAVVKDGETIFVTGLADVSSLKDELNEYFK